MDYLDLRGSSIDDVITNAVYRGLGGTWLQASTAVCAGYARVKQNVPFFVSPFVSEIEKPERAYAIRYENFWMPAVVDMTELYFS